MTLCEEKRKKHSMWKRVAGELHISSRLLAELPKNLKKHPIRSSSDRTSGYSLFHPPLDLHQFDDERKIGIDLLAWTIKEYETRIWVLGAS